MQAYRRSPHPHKRTRDIASLDTTAPGACDAKRPTAMVGNKPPRSRETKKWSSVVRQRETFGLTAAQYDWRGEEIASRTLGRQDRYRRLPGAGLDRCEPPLSYISSRRRHGAGESLLAR